MEYSPTTHDYEEIPDTLSHPDPSSDHLYPSLVQGYSAPSRSSAAPPSSECLYPSLAPFESGDGSSKPLASVALMASTHSPGMNEPVKEMLSQETIEIPHGKYKFMKEKIAEKCSSLNARIVSENESGADKKVHVVLEGTKEAVTEAKLYILPEMINIDENSLKLSKVTARILQGSSGKSEAESKLTGLKVELMDVKGRLSIVGHQDDVSKAVSIVPRHVFHRPYPGTRPSS